MATEYTFNLAKAYVSGHVEGLILGIDAFESGIVVVVAVVAAAAAHINKVNIANIFHIFMKDRKCAFVYHFAKDGANGFIHTKKENRTKQLKRFQSSTADANKKTMPTADSRHTYAHMHTPFAHM